MRKILYDRKSPEIQPLRALIEQQNHRVLVAWALDCARDFLPIFEESCPDEQRPRQALETAEAWAKGETKMPAAKRAIHAAHNAATGAGENPAAEAAARALGHAAATVHVETHALGLVFYGLTALYHHTAPEDREAALARKLDWFYERLEYWAGHTDALGWTWADFLLRDDRPNKEKLLHEREMQKG